MQATEANKSEEVFDVVFPTIDQSSKVMKPGKEPLDAPAAAVTAQWSSILSLAPVAPVRRDHLDAVLFGKLFVELVRVVSFVSDESLGHCIEEASGQNVFHKLTPGRRSAVDSNGDRKTVTSGESDDLRALAATGGANFAPTVENAGDRSGMGISFRQFTPLRPTP